MPREAKTQIPSKPVVRAVASVLLVIGLIHMYLAVIHYSTLGWAALFLFLGGFSISGFALVALKTGNPEWILLDLMVE